jgi:hypothetical protein
MTKLCFVVLLALAAACDGDSPARLTPDGGTCGRAPDSCDNIHSNAPCPGTLGEINEICAETEGLETWTCCACGSDDRWKPTVYHCGSSLDAGGIDSAVH